MENVPHKNNRILFHGSYDKLEVGQHLTGRGASYEADWAKMPTYEILERYRPEGMIAHRDGVFMCDTPDDIDNAGGGTDWIFAVEPCGPVQRHDLNWCSDINQLLEDRDKNQAKIEQAAKNYWAGEAHTDGPVWEYISKSARIIKVEAYEDFEFDSEDYSEANSYSP